MILGAVNEAYEAVPVGMRMLDGYNLNIEVVDGGRVVIEARE